MESTLLALHNDIMSSTDKGKATALVLDRSAVFDTILNLGVKHYQQIL